MAQISKLTKAELLIILESVPQGYWPPRPTRQDKRDLVDVVRRAWMHPGVQTAVIEALARKRQTKK